jgi:23S rRNA pseudouridine1911/1915/1917 synthase
LFTQSPEANLGVSEIFSKHQATKVYQTLCSLKKPGSSFPPARTWTIKNYLGRPKTVAGKERKGSKFCSVLSGGDFAQTEFQLLDAIGARREIFWIQAKPMTGRTHQIRVHLSESGAPILGDKIYDGASRMGEFQVPRLMLHAASLSFLHPIHQTPITIQSTLPEDFKQCLNFFQKKSLRS